MTWEVGLVGQALEIARSPQSPLRVTAGPGTGKTFALMRRLARLLEEGLDPTRALLVTFTRISAADLERELANLGLPRAANVVKGTLHSVCFSFLNRAHVFAFTHRTPRPLLNFEVRFLLEDLGRYGDFGTYYDRRATLRAFEAAWARERDQQPGWPTTPKDQLFQAQMEEWLRFHEGMLIAEIIPQTLHYLRANPEAPELHQFDHVLVDEYQDLNRAEQSLLDSLSQNGSIALVGDQDQAIYEAFRFAHPEGIAEFHESHPGTYDVPLDVSRRCPAAIVALANSLIRHNQRRSGRQLVPNDEEGSVEVQLIQWPTIEEEATGIAEFITSSVREGAMDPGRTLVLCPRRQFGYLIRDELRARGVAAHSYFNEEALEGDPKEIDESRAQQAFSLLTLLAYPTDRVVLRAWLGFGSSNLRAGEYARLRNHCAQSGHSPFEVLDALLEGNEQLPHTTGLVARYSDLRRLLQNLTPLDPPAAFDALFPPDDPWAEPFRAIYDQAGEPLDHAGAHELLRSNITQPELPTRADFVRIMSLHKSKGLTADHVFVPGCVEGLIPTYPIEDLPFEAEMRFVEEQRRLFYVAITRAKRMLVLSSTRTLPRALAYKMRAPVRGGDPYLAQTIASTFLQQLGETCPPARPGNEWLLDPRRR